MRLIKILILLFGVVMVLSCSEDLPADEKKYKETTTELAKLLDGYLDIKLDCEKSEIWDEGNEEYPVGQKIIYEADDIQKRERYFEEKRERWLELDRDLKEFSARFPESVWTDDAAFYRAVEFILTKYPYKFLKEYHIESIETFLSKFEEFNIENWTKVRVGNFYRPLFEIEQSDSGSTENAKIRGTFYKLRIVQYCLDKDYKGAEVTLKRLEAERLPINTFAEECRIIIDIYRKKET